MKTKEIFLSLSNTRKGFIVDTAFLRVDEVASHFFLSSLKKTIKE